jgi:hypothetical protein
VALPTDWIIQLIDLFTPKELEYLERKVAHLNNNTVLHPGDLVMEEPYIDGDWDKIRLETKFFIKKHGGYPCATSADPGEARLGIWVRDQKRTRVYMEQSFPYRFKKLQNSSWWEWEIDLEKTWNQKYEETERFIKENEQWPMRIESGGSIKESMLAQWVTVQRAKKDEMQISNLQRYNRLNNSWWWIWDIHEFQFQENFRAAGQFAQVYGRDPDKRSDDPTVKALGIWMQNHRLRKKHLKENHLHRFEMLDNAPWWSWIGTRMNVGKEWRKSLDRVIHFIKEHKRLPSDLSEEAYEKSLDLWVKTQRVSKATMKNEYPDRFATLNRCTWWKW